jgi:gliding motility-associated-like protein
MKHILLAALALAFSTPLWATHNRAGEIHVQQIGPLTVRATIITWTKTSSINADRDTLTICWGDGSLCQPVLRSNGGGEGVPYPNDVKYNIYIAEHTYSGEAQYRISMSDPNRNAGILNVNFPSSDNVPFHIETVYSFQNQQFGGMNTTPYLIQPPIDNACVGKVFKHNPGASDPDGDSLSYQFIVPLFAEGAPVPNYVFPHKVTNGNFTLTIDADGNIVWNAPDRAGEYNLAFIIVSWRNGNPIDTTIRDMQIFVAECDNNPPTVMTKEDICVIAGSSIAFTVTGTDPDSGQLVRLTALGGPFTSPYSPATFDAPAEYAASPVEGVFRWNTVCEHISNQPYTVVFKALDTLGGTQLADLKAVTIKVVGPQPLDLQANAQQGKVNLSWAAPYSCEVTQNNYFYTFSVWRRVGSNPFPLDTCDPGLEGKGYTRIVFSTKDQVNGRYEFTDSTVERGQTYCYRVEGVFARRSSAGYPYNVVQSLPSEEVCAQLPRDLPVITNVSIETTDMASGQVEVRWSKPVARDLDTLLNPGPYRYQVLRATGLNGGTLQAVPGGSFTSNSFAAANDTFFRFDDNLDTKGFPYHYQVEFYVNGAAKPLGKTREASSVRLLVSSTDQANILSWTFEVPWNNYRYDIFRKGPASTQYDSIGSTDKPPFEDRGLTNGLEYCYYVRSVGTYSIGGLADPLLNLSQEDCGIPIDTVPPCPPVLSVLNLCDEDQPADPAPPFVNYLRWTNPNATCNGTDDAVGYKIWYAKDEGAPLTLLASIQGVGILEYEQSGESVAGCFAVSAIDSVGNESRLSNIICKDNCPFYELPNAFTPNGDGANDVFKPFPSQRFIESIDFQAFNVWGNLVFETTDPNINWDGTNAQGKALAEGTYYYVCRIFEQRVDGVSLSPAILSGFIELMRGGR